MTVAQGLAAAWWTEWLKARRSKAMWIISLAGAIAPLASGLFMLILKDPVGAQRLGIISVKAQIMAGTADWPAMLKLLGQLTAGGGLALFGLICIWMFGREHSDHTAKDLLALPTPRWAIMLAKFGVAAVWQAALLLLILALGMCVGLAVGLPGWTSELALSSAGLIILTGVLTILLVAPVAWMAGVGRGYLPPVGFLLLLVVLAQIISVLGWGAYFPWSVTGVVVNMIGTNAEPAPAVSYLLVALTGLAGVGLTVLWWQRADQQ